MKKPNFFVVGAPKCGTTSMCNYLGEHKEIFIPERKELYYFCTDFRTHKYRVANEQEYLSYFTKAGNLKCIGEGSVWYLYSKEAAQNIKIFKDREEAIQWLIQVNIKTSS